MSIVFSHLTAAVVHAQVFAGLRRNSHGDGTLALPGGHLEMYETWEECARREVLEETGLAIRNLRFGHVTNDPMEDQGKHYVTIFMMGECVCQDTRPQNLEPHKCHGWDSYGWEELCRFAEAAASSAGREGKKDDSPILFGPLLKLVEESPELVLDFINNRQEAADSKTSK